MYRITVLVQGIVGFRKRGDRLGVGIPNTLVDEPLKFEGYELRRHEPMLVLSWRKNHDGRTVPDEFLRLGPDTQISACVGASETVLDFPAQGAPRMQEILGLSHCPWDARRLLFPEFELPAGSLRGWPGTNHGGLENEAGHEVESRGLGATWTMGVNDSDTFKLRIDSPGGSIELAYTSSASIWLVNHPTVHAPPKKGDPEVDFAWHYWLLHDHRQKAFPVPTSPTEDVPHISLGLQRDSDGRAQPPIGTGGQLCRPCEFCPD